ncbi:uncharacterized protein [Ptychodera flava]|uniref:uncharacterized protein n=1 Tax=Ptychodera flava TaxID=63121 RepID=UPI00396A9BC9
MPYPMICYAIKFFNSSAPSQARVNIPSVSTRRLRVRAEENEFKADTSIQRWHEDLQDDRVFLREGQKAAVAKFNKKQGDNNTPESTLMRLSWEVHEYTMLHQICDEYIDVCACYLQEINEDAQRSPNHVIAAIHAELNEMLEYLRNLYKKKRTAASHVLVFMVADEQRQTKPYALPVRYILYDSLKDSTYQRLMDEVKKEIVKAGLKPIGSVTDGEFNSCRYNSISGKPTSVFKLRMMAKDKVSRLHPKTLLEMLLTRRVNNEGIHVTERHNPAIPQSTIARVDELLARGWSMRDVLLHIRQGQFPHEDYAPYPWRAKTPESQTDLLRSIFAQFEFKALVSAHSTAEQFSYLCIYSSIG